MLILVLGIQYTPTCCLGLPCFLLHWLVHIVSGVLPIHLTALQITQVVVLHSQQAVTTLEVEAEGVEL